MCCTQLAKNTGCKNDKITKNSPSAHHRTTLSGSIFATKACTTIGKKNLLNSNISSTCPHNVVNFGPLTAEIDSRSCLGHPSKVQRVSRLAVVRYCRTSLTGGQPNFARYLAVSWAGTLYIFAGSCPVTEFCQVQH